MRRTEARSHARILIDTHTEIGALARVGVLLRDARLAADQGAIERWSAIRAELRLLTQTPGRGMSIRNHLLSAMIDFIPPAEIQEVDLPKRMKLVIPRVTTEWVYFPESGIASIIFQQGGMAQEAGLFGVDGMSSLSAVLGSPDPHFLTVMQVAGRGHRIRVSDLRTVLSDNGELRYRLMAHVCSRLSQLSQTATANTQLNTEQRLARWLMMIRDRMSEDSFDLTHEYLAFMLGVRRTGVTLALSDLRGRNMIQMRRSTVEILDPAGLLGMTRGLVTVLADDRRSA